MSDSGPPNRALDREQGAREVGSAKLKLISLVSVISLSSFLLYQLMYQAPPSHEVKWQGPSARPPLSASEPPPTPRQPKSPIKASAVRGEIHRSGRGRQPEGSFKPAPPPPSNPLPTIPQGGWDPQALGVIAGPVSGLERMFKGDSRWSKAQGGAWRREDADGTLQVTETREERITELTLTFGPQGSSPLMPEIELLVLGGDSPSTTRWIRFSGERARWLGGRLTQRLKSGGERVVYYLCDYGAPAASRELPERCTFSFELTQEARSLGSSLRPAPQW